MSKRYGLISMLILVATILATCSSQTGITPTQTPEISTSGEEKNQEPETAPMDKLITFLKESGVIIEIGGVIEAPFFSTQGKVLRADNEEIQVYIYPDSRSRQADSDTISSDGTIKGQAKISWISQPFFWAHDELLVIYLGSNSELIDLISYTLGDPISQPDSSDPVDDPTSDYPVAVLAAIRDLSERLDINPDQITVIGYENKVWPDSCLGVEKAGEMCLQVLTPGYSITLSVGDKRFVYHTDEIGQRLVLVGEMSPEGLKPGLDLEKSKAILSATQNLNQHTKVPISQISVVSAESVEWPDSCLGLADQNELCAQIIVPGWLIILETGGIQYVYHTDMTGQNLRLK